MRIVAEYAFAGGKKLVEQKWPALLPELRDAITSVDASAHQTKKSREATMQGRMLFAPTSINKAIKQYLEPLEWKRLRVACDYSTAYYVGGYQPTVRVAAGAPYREMDFVKNRLGVEVQFGKYAFMVYNVAAKMTIFRNLDFIDAGIEIVPVKEMAACMSSGVSYFEQFVWDLERRGLSDIDVPALIWGIAP